MLFYILGVALMGYFSHKAIMALPKGREDELNADELEWYYGR